MPKQETGEFSGDSNKMMKIDLVDPKGQEIIDFLIINKVKNENVS